VEINNLEITSDGGTTGTDQPSRSGVHLTTEGKGAFQSVVLRNLHIHDVFNEAHGGAVGIRVDRSDDSTFRDIRIEQCRIERTAFMGISVKRVKELSVIDNQLKHIGGPGIVPHQSQGVVLRGNTVDHSGSNADRRMHNRGSGAWCIGCTDVLVEKNKFMHARGVLDSCGFHVDIGNRNVIVQYNFSLDNAGGFVQILGRNQNVAYRYNISVNDGWRVKGVDGAIGNGHILTTSGFNVLGKPHAVGIGPTNTYIYNNTIHVRKDLPAIFSFAPTTDGLLIANNIFHVLGPTKHELSGWDKSHAPPEAKIKNVVFRNNLYLHEGVLPKDMPILDDKPMIGDAGFTRPGGVEAGDHRPTSVISVKGNGVIIENLPGDNVGLKGGIAVRTDFFGNPIGGSPDLGAVETGASVSPATAR
jgi:hypothetical protein